MESEATVYTCGIQSTYRSPQYLVVFSFKADDMTYSGEYHSLSPVQEGSTFTIGYNPANPDQNTKCPLTKAQNLRMNIVMWVLGIFGFALFIWWDSHRHR